MLSSTLFPGRTSLYAHEVSRVLSISSRQVLRLVEAGYLEAVRVSTEVDRSHHRITVSSYDQFILQGGTQPNGLGRVKNGCSHGPAGRNGGISKNGTAHRAVVTATRKAAR